VKVEKKQDRPSAKIEIIRRNLRKILKKREEFLLRRFLSRLHPGEIADAIEDFSVDEMVEILMALEDPKKMAKVLTYMNEDVAADIVEKLPGDIVKKIFTYLPSDEIIFIMDEIEEPGEKEEIEDIVDELPQEKKRKITSLRLFPEDSAGRLMVPTFYSVHPEEKIGDVLKEIKGLEDVETLPYVYVVDSENRLLGVASIKQLVSSDPDQPVGEIMNTQLITVDPYMDQEEVARLFARYNLVQLPVVDNSGRILGIITIDDVVDVIREEAEEDLLKMAGAGESLIESLDVRKNVARRLPWLFGSWVGGIVEIEVLHYYEPTISKLAILASFMPIILGMGGNIGQQSAAIVIAGLASGRVKLKDSFELLKKQVITGFVLGAIYGILVGLIAAFRSTQIPVFTLVVVLSMTAEMTIASFVGTFLPLFFAFIKVDPAVATGPFISTTMDIIGIFTYFTTSIFLLKGYLA